MIDAKAPSPAHLVSTDWLATRLGEPDLAVLDASWYLPAMNRDGRAEYLAGHIPGAAFFDIDEIADHSTSLPHMLPDQDAFARAMGELGVGDGMEVVVYDGAGLFSAPRVWWMLRIFGVRNVHVLDGGLPKWTAEGRPVERGAPKRRDGQPAGTQFTARFDEGAVASFDDVRRALESGVAQVADARSAPRFNGEAPEPRPGLPSGHMPGACNVPATSLVADGRLKPTDAVLRAFAQAGVDPDRPLITSCGSGVSAAILNLALAMANKPAPRLYDGSWSEWAARPDAPIDPEPQR